MDAYWLDKSAVLGSRLLYLAHTCAPIHSKLIRYLVLGFWNLCIGLLLFRPEERGVSPLIVNINFCPSVVKPGKDRFFFSVRHCHLWAKIGWCSLLRQWRVASFVEIIELSLWTKSACLYADVGYCLRPKRWGLLALCCISEYCIAL